MTDHLKDLSAVGVSIWLDDLSRVRLTSGSLKELIDGSSVVGVTTNPSIFDKAIAGGSSDYAEQVKDLKARKVSVDEAIRAMTAYDVRWACDLFRPTYDATEGYDGRVSIEVDPRLAHDTETTAAEAVALHWLVDRENVLIKIPATLEGLPAITETIGRGISVNVTLIFSVERYKLVIDAWVKGLEIAQAAGLDLGKIHSVASFFVSRVDTSIDNALSKIGTPEAEALKGVAGIANARLAYQYWEEFTATDRWKALEAAGARVQRPLWASTGVKDPAYPDDEYVVELAAPHIVNTMPEATLNAVRDHGHVKGNTIDGTYEASAKIFADVAAAGVDLDEVFKALEDEGVEKFAEAWDDLIAHVKGALGQ